MKTGIYCIENTITNKKYIGQSVDINDRWSRHRIDLRLNRHCNSIIQNSWNKYGEEFFKFYILEEVTEREFLNDREIYWIENLNTLYPNGMNIQNGGKSSPVSDITKEKLSKINSGKNNPGYGIPRTQEVKDKISKANKGKKRTEQQNKENSVRCVGRIPWNKGKKMSEEFREKCSQNMKGKIPWNKGKHIKEERYEAINTRKN